MDIGARIEVVLERFRSLSSVPRGSGREGKVREWVTDWARGMRFETQTDAAGNLLVRVPPSAGSKPTVVLQGHLDMVCEKTPDSGHDFARDGIEIVRDGEWLRARKTTLGADNGIGVALALAASEDPSLPHPPLELLFTVEEETGLRGAAALESGFLTGRTLVNLDSEELGVLTVGCAGGQDSVLTLPSHRRAAPPSASACRVRVGGLRGGHSGTDIHRGGANAILLLARALREIGRSSPLRIVEVSGGSARNAIPRDASAVLALTEAEIHLARSAVDALRDVISRAHAAVEPGLELELVRELAREAASPSLPLSPERSDLLVRLLLALPNGVAGLSREFPGVVETSSNVGVISANERGDIEIVSSQRSSSAVSLRELTERIETVASLVGASARSGSGYPPWQPDLSSPVLARCRAVWTARHGTEPEVRIIHAGLECAVIGARVPGMDMVSFGPTIEGAHSPAERLRLDSLAGTWELLSDLLASLAS